MSGWQMLRQELLDFGGELEVGAEWNGRHLREIAGERILVEEHVTSESHDPLHLHLEVVCSRILLWSDGNRNHAVDNIVQCSREPRVAEQVAKLPAVPPKLDRSGVAGGLSTEDQR